jgi:plastocyanin
MTRKRLALSTLVLAGGLVAASQASDVVVVQKEKAFNVTSINVRSGDRVIFRNDDQVVHNVYSTTPGFEFEIKTQLPGQTSEQRFKGEGEAEVRCAIHPQMKLKVHVEK